MKRTALLTLALPTVVVALGLLPQNKKQAFHDSAELEFLRQHFQLVTGGPTPDGSVFIPIDSNVLFPTAKLCGGCHGYDINQHALVTNEGVDVNIYDDWRSTMMANSARDPFWRAKVTHELLVNPSHSTELQDKCTSCHAPAGHYQAKLHDGAEHYSFYDVLTDSLALDGVTCQACHAQAPGDLGSLHSGQINFDPNNIRVAYGPYPQAFAPPMHNFVGITPKYGEHINDAGLCAGCHTLITGTVDLEGQSTGNTFVEQATYHEWLNSRYDSENDNITCQNCHFPRIPDEVIISANYQFLTPKSPFGLHEMAGANVTMLKLLRDNREALGITATPTMFDSTIAATLRMLQHKTLDLSLTPSVVGGDSAVFALRLTNKAGHKFPSGYPSRRAWVEIEVYNTEGDLVLSSGKMAPDGTLPDEDPNLEPHHQVIDRPGQVQIYELVPGDVNNNFTNVLERGNYALKDNRLTPQGFSVNDPVYDTTLIVGGALTDPDFNRFDTGEEGSGSDIVYIKVPITDFGTLSVRAKVWYQSLPPKWMLPMFDYSSPQIDTFKTMYNSADLSPTLVAEVALENVPVSPVSTTQLDPLASIRVTPTLTYDGVVRVDVPASLRLSHVRVWDTTGRLVWNQAPADGTLRLPRQSGVYLVEIQTNRGRKVVKVVRG